MERTQMIEQMRTRRSIRKYTKEPVDEQTRAVLVEAALRSPTSKSKKSSSFVFVDDPALLGALSKAKPRGAAFLADAPLGIVVCGDEGVSDCWMENSSIACTFLHLAAHSLGLGSCWVQIRGRPDGAGGQAEEAVRRLLGIPKEKRVLAIIAVGHPAENPPGLTMDESNRGSVHRNDWGASG